MSTGFHSQNKRFSNQNPPPSTSTRLHGLDLARFFAFTGMVLVNFGIVMALPDQQNILAQFNHFLQGKAAALFVVLAGVGLQLARQRTKSDNTKLILKRAAFLLVLGLINSTFFQADILHFYAFYFLIGAFCLPLANSRLLLLIIGLTVTASILIVALPFDQGWDWADYHYRDFWTVPGFFRHVFYNGWHPVIPWLAYLLFGFLLARAPLSETWFQRRLILFGSFGLILAEALAILLQSINPFDELAPLLTTSPVPAMPLYLVAGGSGAALLIGLSLQLCRNGKIRRLCQPMLEAGKQTLSLYIAHIFLGMGTMEALGMLGNSSSAQVYGATLLFATLSCLYAWLWRKRLKRGPIEALMRKITG